MNAEKLGELLLKNSIDCYDIVPSPDDEEIGRQAVLSGEWPDAGRDHNLNILGQVMRMTRSRDQLEAEVHAYQLERGISALYPGRFVFPLHSGRTVAIEEKGWGLELQPGDGERLTRCIQRQATTFLAFQDEVAAAAGWALWREIDDEVGDGSSFHPATTDEVRCETSTATSGYLDTSPWLFSPVHDRDEAVLLHIHQGTFPGDAGDQWVDETATARFVLASPGQLQRLRDVGRPASVKLARQRKGKRKGKKAAGRGLGK